MPSRFFALLVFSFSLIGCSVLIDDELSGKGGAAPGGASPGGGGSSATSGGGGVAECTSPDDCQGSDTTCRHRTCDGGQCGNEDAPSGTTCPEDDGKVCDGNGACVECVIDRDCAGDSSCLQNQCVLAHCLDQVLSGDESDVDCGGGCPPCDDGQSCFGYADCASKFCDTGSAGGGGAIGGGGSGGSMTATGICAPCADHDDCDAAPSTHCDAGDCVDDLVDGSPCSEGAECQSGQCPSPENVCCDAACDATCESCLQASTGLADGTCGPITAGTDPDGECLDQGATSCGANGSGCNGSAFTPGCNLYGAQTVCVAQACTAGVATPAQLCDGSGTCVTQSPINCDPYVCDAQTQACKTSCTGDGDCVMGSFCNLGTSTCSTVKGLGASCSSASECSSGHCVDGVCCNTACTAPCAACDLFGLEGTCSPHNAGTDPDGDCGAGQTCDGGGACLKVNGQLCATSNECLSGFCPGQDGVCCDTACSGTCQACSAAKTGANNGTCAAVVFATDPDNECTDQGAASCGANGTGCNGQQASPGCRFYPSSTTCIAPTCSSGTGTPAGQCDGAGTCQPGTPASCDPYICNGSGTACLTTCSTELDCIALHYCGAGACLPKKANGVSCGSGDECLSGGCVDGVCCNVACAGTCQACSAAKTGGTDGTCGFVAASTDPDGECAGAQLCDGSGVCKLPNGEACGVPGDCLSGSCVDGVCCNSSCAGTCQACTAAQTGGTDGVCSFVPANSDPDGECGVGELCDGGGSCLSELGESCLNGSDCLSGECADGVCCDVACSGTCQACVASKTGGVDGLCAFVSPNTDPDAECMMGELCDGGGTCLGIDGSPCNGGADCLSSACADGVCCDLACSGTCEACTAAKTGGSDGVCSAIPAAQDPDMECAPGDCDGSGSCANCTHDWSQAFGNGGQDQFSASVAVDGSGDVVMTGRFRDPVDFGGGLVPSAGGKYDVFVAKYDAAGAYQWDVTFGDGSEDQVAADVAVDGSGNVIVVGHYKGTVDFGGGPYASTARRSIFIVKLDANGTHQWSKSVGNGSQDQFATSVAVDASGAVFVTGRARDTLDFGGGPEPVSGGKRDAFLVKYDASGAYQWTVIAGNDGQDIFGEGVAVDAFGDVVFTGRFKDSVNFGGGAIASVGAKYDVFVAKYDGATGSHQWSDGYGNGNQDIFAAGVAVDANGDAVITGRFKDPVNFGGGAIASVGAKYDVFVAKYDGVTGNHQWSDGFGNGSDDQSAADVAVDGSNNVIVTGAILGMVDFGGGTLNAGSTDDIFLAKYAPDGTHLCSQAFGNASGSQRASSVTAGPTGAMLFVGDLLDPVDFGGGLLSSAGGKYDVVLARYDP